MLNKFLFMTRSSLDAEKAALSADFAMLSWEMFTRKSASLELSLMELVKMRAWQLGRNFCRIELSSVVLPARQENHHKLGAVNAWRETPLFTDRERAALAWTEAVTRITEASTLITSEDVPDKVYQEVRQQFSEKELLNLTMAVAAFYEWNHVGSNITLVPDEYQLEP